jgi:hypothetical protein
LKILTITFEAQWIPQEQQHGIPASSQKWGIYADSVFIAIQEKLCQNSILVNK